MRCYNFDGSRVAGRSTGSGCCEPPRTQPGGCIKIKHPAQEPYPMTTSLDLTKLSLMDALDLAILIEEEARQRYELFASLIGRSGGRYDAGSFFASMAENEAKHGTELLERRMKLFGKKPMKQSGRDKGPRWVVRVINKN